MTGRATGPAPKKRILPPVYFLLAIGIMAALHHLAPGMRLIPPPLTYLGWIPIGVGFLVASTAILQFRRSGTTHKPFEDPSALVTGGVYRFSRNPMYTCLTLALIGVVILFGTVTPAAVVPGFVWLIRSRFIAAEERVLEDAFGEAYRDYKTRVRRWL